MGDSEEAIKRLLENPALDGYDLDEEGVWNVYGENPSDNDFFGAHNGPFIGRYEGKLRDVLEKAIALPSFYSYGAGGRVEKHQPVMLDMPEGSTQEGMYRTLQQRKNVLEANLDDVNDILGQLEELMKDD